MKLAIAVTVLMSIAALLVVWNLPVLLHFCDLAFPKPGLYEPILEISFDFWKEKNSVVLPLDCRWERRIYEVAVVVPAVPAELRADREPTWPDLSGLFLVTIKRNGRTVLERSFTGRARSVHRTRNSSEALEIYSLQDFPLRRCGGSTLELAVLKPATGSSGLRDSARLIVRVSPEI